MGILKDTSLPPQWVLDVQTKRCSVCGYPLQVGDGQSVDKVFKEHVLKAHRPGQTSKDANQASRTVRENTERH
jgi:hypothetical protein